MHVGGVFFFFFPLLPLKMKGGCCSVTQSCLALCNPKDCSTPGFPVLHRLPELAQTHVRRVGDAIQPFHPCRPLLLPPSIFPSIRVCSSALALSIGSQSIGASASASVLPMNIQVWFPLEMTGLIALTTIMRCGVETIAKVSSKFDKQKYNIVTKISETSHKYLSF